MFLTTGIILDLVFLIGGSAYVFARSIQILREKGPKAEPRCIKALAIVGMPLALLLAVGAAIGIYYLIPDLILWWNVTR